MHTYRYYACDIMTGNMIADLPLYGVYCDKKIGQTGSFTGSFRLGTEEHDDQSMLDATIPGKTEVYVERDNELVWGGILWSRTYNSEASLISLTGQTFESYFDHVCIDANFIEQGIEQTTILRDLVNMLQSQSGNNIRLLMDAFPTTGVQRTVLIPGYEYHFAQDVIDQLVGVDGGIEITVDITASATPDRPNRTLRTGYPKLGRYILASGLYYDYPGTIDQYWWNESGSRGAVKAVALGHGEGFQTVRGQAIDGDKIAAGWPGWWIVNAHKNIADVDGIQDAAVKDLHDFAIPYCRPTFQFNEDAANLFHHWNNLGDEVSVRIDDVRFPGGKVIQTRMMGWELSPAEGENEEVLKIVMEGEDDAA